jgi:hypothetical protein
MISRLQARHPKYKAVHHPIKRGVSCLRTMHSCSPWTRTPLKHIDHTCTLIILKYQGHKTTNILYYPKRQCLKLKGVLHHLTIKYEWQHCNVHATKNICIRKTIYQLYQNQSNFLLCCQMWMHAGKTPLEMNFTYLGNREIYCILTHTA